MVTKTDNNCVIETKEKKQKNADNSFNERNDHYHNSNKIAEVAIGQECPILILQ